MTSITLRSVRFAFVTLLLGLTTFTVAESAMADRQASAEAAAEGLSTCGTQEQPCALEMVGVVAAPAPNSVSFAANEGLAACGSEEQPCVLAPIAVEAEREPARLASTSRIARMMVRVGS